MRLTRLSSRIYVLHGGEEFILHIGDISECIYIEIHDVAVSLYLLGRLFLNLGPVFE